MIRTIRLGHWGCWERGLPHRRLGRKERRGEIDQRGYPEVMETDGIVKTERSGPFWILVMIFGTRTPNVMEKIAFHLIWSRGCLRSLSTRRRTVLDGGAF